MTEQLFISLPNEHTLVSRNSLKLEDIKGIRILANSTIGFWKDIILEKLSEDDLLIQSDFDAYIKLIHASNLPFFNSVRGNLIK